MLEGYTELMKGLLTPIPDAQYEIKAASSDDARNIVTVFTIITDTQTGEGGPVPSTGNALVADYVYAIAFDGDKIRHMAKVWNHGHSLKQLGWA